MNPAIDFRITFIQNCCIVVLQSKPIHLTWENPAQSLKSAVVKPGKRPWSLRLLLARITPPDQCMIWYLWLKREKWESAAIARVVARPPVLLGIDTVYRGRRFLPRLMTALIKGGYTYSCFDHMRTSVLILCRYLHHVTCVINFYKKH